MPFVPRQLCGGVRPGAGRRRGPLTHPRTGAGMATGSPPGVRCSVAHCRGPGRQHICRMVGLPRRLSRCGRQPELAGKDPLGRGSIGDVSPSGGEAPGESVYGTGPFGMMYRVRDPWLRGRYSCCPMLSGRAGWGAPRLCWHAHVGRGDAQRRSASSVAPRSGCERGLAFSATTVAPLASSDRRKVASVPRGFTP